jgi:hypothetical protein
MNAVSKGVSLGIYEGGKERGMEAVKGGSQSYVELMGRRYARHHTKLAYGLLNLLPPTTLARMFVKVPSVSFQMPTYIYYRPLYRSQADQWRALSNGIPVQPSTAFSYISRAFRQTTPHVIGSLRLLASSFTVHEMNSKAWSLYADFRPAVDEWGKRSEVKCSTILALRKKNGTASTDLADLMEVVKSETPTQESTEATEQGEQEQPQQKRLKTLTLEEYEAALDQDFAYDELDLVP